MCFCPQNKIVQNLCFDRMTVLLGGFAFFWPPWLNTHDNCLQNRTIKHTRQHQLVRFKGLAVLRCVVFDFARSAPCSTAIEESRWTFNDSETRQDHLKQCHIDVLVAKAYLKTFVCTSLIGRGRSVFLKVFDACHKPVEARHGIQILPYCQYSNDWHSAVTNTMRWN